MNQELVTILIGFGGALLGYFLRQLQIKPIPVPVPGPVPGPGPAPAPVPGPLPDYPLLNQLLELLRQLLSRQGVMESLSGGAPAAPSNVVASQATGGLSITVPFEVAISPSAKVNQS